MFDDVGFLTFMGALAYMFAQRSDDVWGYAIYTLVFAWCLSQLVDKVV